MSNCQCTICGRFCRVADLGVPFGGGNDLEPPEDELYCERCARAQEEDSVRRGWVPNDWVKTAWQRRAAKRLGLVEVSIKGNGWTIWAKPDSIPAGYERVNPEKVTA